ncbi:pyruvate kinase [Candidatus Falkowbacteria bacterium]|jgi:pyruvate kinase|nr:pyruvate kinase [Candidatus Falkowbacteria bacterium]MBT5502786.1 pyruvate kinase [Candidatus Falkowbacteria bacterium]MBT7348841.1 pyruvate kinase [Candidatus Falkowbacteria bacterium]MBT7500992.1 pyruvate kinase [Candidatus Falkowbacteria bacterium]
MKRTKIVCTLGPASDKKTIIKQLIRNGMNMARFNFSHNVHAYHGRVLRLVRSAAKEVKQSVAILQDLQGPRIRLGDLPKKGINLVRGSEIILTTDTKKNKKKIPVTYKNMHRDVKAGQRVLIADGVIELMATKVRGKDIYCKVQAGGVVTSHKGINLPDTDVTVPALSEKDKKDLMFGIKNAVDFVALSFVRNAKEVSNLKDLITKYEKKLKIKSKNPIKIIVKVERKEAIENLDEIIAVADGIMVARGDLGIELSAEDVPLMQKMIIDKCLTAAKPVIVATQMLESMVNNPRPTRAEASDVANAVIDHTDAVMLSGETAAGKYPVKAVEYMRKIIEKTEQSAYDDLVIKHKIKQIKSTSDAVSSLAKTLADQINAKLILVASISGHSGRVVSRYRPELPIFVACEDHRVQRQLQLTWGAIPFVLHRCKDLPAIIKKAETYLKLTKQAKKNDKMIVVAGVPVGKSGKINLVEVKEVS